MLNDMSEYSQRYGLRINFAKTKALTWNHSVGSRASIQVGGEQVAVVDETASERYVGRKLVFQNSHYVELQNRIASGWAAFHKQKNLLRSKLCRLADRAKLFESVVTPAVLYGSSTWALTRSMKKSLKTVRLSPAPTQG